MGFDPHSTPSFNKSKSYNPSKMNLQPACVCGLMVLHPLEVRNPSLSAFIKKEHDLQILVEPSDEMHQVQRFRSTPEL